MDEFDWERLHPWMKIAYDFGMLHDSWEEIHAKTPEHEAWRKYFDELGYAPNGFRKLGRSARSWTAPCQWPNALPAFECETRAKGAQARSV